MTAAVIRIYTDTSVIGGCEDEEFRSHSRRLMDSFARGDLRMVLSELTVWELTMAPPAVRKVLSAVPESSLEMIQLTVEADRLARVYVEERILQPSMLVDAQHIAMATVANVNALVSWNFKHVVNLARIQAVHRVNAKLGYPLIEIRSPREVVADE